MARQKITEEARFDVARVLEDAPSDGKLHFEAIVSEGDHINANGRMYPFDVLWPAFQAANENITRYGAGTVDHPDPWEGVSLSDIGVKWEQFWPDGKLIKGRGSVVGTTKGKDLEAVIESGLAVGFSTRTQADGESIRIGDQTVYVIKEMEPPYVDAVSNPSVAHARVQSYAREEIETMDKELQEALERQHKAETEAAVLKATMEKDQAIAALTKAAEAADARIATLTEENTALQAKIAELQKDEAKTALEAKLITLTGEHRFGATIRAKALELGVTLDTAEAMVKTLTTWAEELATAGNELGGNDRKPGDGAPNGNVKTSEDKDVSATTPDSELTEKQRELREAGLL